MQDSASHQSIDSLLKVMDAASELRRQREAAHKQLDVQSAREQIREKIKAATDITGEELDDGEIESAISHYFNGLYRFQKPKKGLQYRLAKIYVRRKEISSILTPLLLTLFLLAAGYYGYQGISGRIHQAKVQKVKDLIDEVPERANAFVNLITDVSLRDDATLRSKELYQEIKSLSAAGKIQEAKKALADLERLHTQLLQSYDIRVVSRYGELSGIDRYITDESGKRASGYYVILEARDKNDKIISLPIRNSETGETEVVTKWGERVSLSVFNVIKADKADNGIVDNNLFAKKKIGLLEREVVFHALENRAQEIGGKITRW